PGKGDPRWQAKTGALFLGIDHSAIAVGDTERSLRFHRGLLGLRVAGESLNYGVEQERLNHVFGSRVRITGLRAPHGPGVECLEYLIPRDGRPYPVDAKPNDLWHWHITLRVDGGTELLQRLRSNKVRWISPEIIDVRPLALDGKRAGLIRDPDGHALLLVEP
ncbi:MAG TPA: VOC family protein, partial [Candidatus Acidoferrum sp.]|nr:VOC family protein [Candidatus Acidoferrum sp.]